jgi:multiple sugar transport system substrate-binding protein
MTSIKTLSVAAALLAGTALSAQAQELHFIMCGGEVRAADQKVIDTFIAENPGVSVNMEAVEWGTCQDKSMQLAAAGDAPSIAYMGSRTLRQLAKNDLIVPVTFSAEEEAMFQPGVLSTVSSGGQYWGIPHAFSTKALYINCAVVEAAGAACTAPETYADLVALAKTVTDNTDAAGIGIAGKDFDNTMHMFLDFLYSNDGLVFDADGKPALDSQNTRETLQLYADLMPYMQSGPIEWERDQMKDLFNDGQIAMYVTGPWGKGQHAEKVPSQMVVPIPHGPSGDSGTILITDSIAVFKGTGHEDMAIKLAKALTSGEAQYDLDSSWGLTPILDYQKAGMSDVYYTQDPWPVFVAGISTGGPEPMVEDFKSLQAVFTNMVQGIMLNEGSVDELVTIAGEELAEVR